MIDLKRASFLVLVIVLLGLKSNSQEFIYHRGLATLTMGVAIPAYDFGSGSGINLSSHVKMGTNITAEVSYFTNFHVGMNFMITYSINPINTDELADAYLLESPAFVTTSAEARPFRDLAGLGGMVLDIPVFDRVSMSFKMMGGLRSIYKPTSVVKTTTVFSGIDYYETHSNNVVFALLFSGGARFYINDYFNLHFNASYMGSTLNLEYFRNNKAINQKTHIGVLTMNAGVSYSF